VSRLFDHAYTKPCCACAAYSLYISTCAQPFFHCRLLPFQQGANGQRGLVLNPAVLRRSAKRVHTAVASRRGALLGAHIADNDNIATATATATANSSADVFDTLRLRGTRSAGSILLQSR
jgi:hypothetical protein